MTAAEDDEVVGIRDDLRPEHFTASGEPPMLQEPVHVQVGQQRTDDTALRRAAPAPFASSQAPFSVSIPSFNRRLQPQLDEPQHFAVDDAARHTTQQLRMWDRVKVLRQIWAEPSSTGDSRLRGAPKRSQFLKLADNDLPQTDRGQPSQLSQK